MAYEMVMPYHLHMPSYFLETFTEYPYFGWDVTVVRIIYSFATVFTAFSGIIVYIILWIVMPEKKYRDGYEDRMNDRLHNR